jgi:hypothetical protein
MDRKRVLEALETLKAELAGADVDPQTRETLERMAGDIQTRMEAGPADEGEAEEPLSGQLQDVVQEFGAEHPKLSGAINQVAAALANLGI